MSLLVSPYPRQLTPHTNNVHNGTCPREKTPRHKARLCCPRTNGIPGSVLQPYCSPSDCCHPEFKKSFGIRRDRLGPTNSARKQLCLVKRCLSGLATLALSIKYRCYNSYSVLRKMNAFRPERVACAFVWFELHFLRSESSLCDPLRNSHCPVEM